MIRQRHVGSHQHQPRQQRAGSVAAAQAGQPVGGQGLRGQRRQPLDQAGGALTKKASWAVALRLVGGGEFPDRLPQGRQLLRPLPIHRHAHVVPEGGQPLSQLRLSRGAAGGGRQ